MSVHLIAGLDRPTEGTLLVDGINVGGLNEAALARYRRQRLGFIANHALRLRLVGVYCDLNNFGRVLRFDWSTFLEAMPGTQPDFYKVTLRPAPIFSSMHAVSVPVHLIF